MLRRSTSLLDLLYLLLKVVPKKILVHATPLTDDREEWRAYWQLKGLPWRTEPEISLDRQEYLTHCLSIVPDIEKGIYPFRDIKLNRADVEWLLTTHENGRGPIDWNDVSQRSRVGLDLRGANLCNTDLTRLPLARLRGSLGSNEWAGATDEQRAKAAILMNGASMMVAELDGAHLRFASLEDTDLRYVSLERTHLRGASLKGADLRNSHMGATSLVDVVLLISAQVAKPRVLGNETSSQTSIQHNMQR